MKAEKLKEESAVEVAAYMQKLGQQAREASRVLARATTNDKNAALLAIATAIRSQAVELKTANQQDLQSGKAKGLDAAMLDRLTLSQWHKVWNKLRLYRIQLAKSVICGTGLPVFN